ncbi:MAG TPA: inorganic diphosphatase [Bryobacteraceae bacterium]|nr:inorganic diphosphatase [Bryobacteraceae bacterium]
MNRLYDIDPGPETPEIVRMIVEIPQHSANKYEYDGELGVFRLDRALYSPLHYPGDYGFIPGTLADDGDPLDVLVLVQQPSYPGVMIEVRPVGVLNMVDSEEKDQKILAVPNRNPRYDQIHTMDQIFAHVKREIEHFFSIYKELEGKVTTMDGWGGPREARVAVQECRQRYLDVHASNMEPTAIHA